MYEYEEVDFLLLLISNNRKWWISLGLILSIIDIVFKVVTLNILFLGIGVSILLIIVNSICMAMLEGLIYRVADSLCFKIIISIFTIMYLTIHFVLSRYVGTTLDVLFLLISVTIGLPALNNIHRRINLKYR